MGNWQRLPQRSQVKITGIFPPLLVQVKTSQWSSSCQVFTVWECSPTQISYWDDFTSFSVLYIINSWDWGLLLYLKWSYQNMTGLPDPGFFVMCLPFFSVCLFFISSVSSQVTKTCRTMQRVLLKVISDLCVWMLEIFSIVRMKFSALTKHCLSLFF